MSIIGSAIADSDRYDWGLILGSATLSLVALLLQAPLWAIVIAAIVGPTITGGRGACRDLGLFGHPDLDEQSATVSADSTRNTDTRSSSTADEAQPEAACNR